MKRTQKYIALLCTTLSLVVMMTALCCMERPDVQPFSVVISHDGREETISCWENEKDQLYVFLPSGVELSDVQLIRQTDNTILFEGQPMDEAFLCSTLSLDVPYEVTYSVFGKAESKTIVLVQSAGVPTLFVSTDYGSSEYLHADKSNKESGTVTVYAADGQLVYQGAAESVGGRGNYTWVNSEKKPYNIVLSQGADLLDMGQGSKWVLLANASDSTLMRNKIVYDFANRIGLAYSPESQWVALYLNGEYRGLYLMCEAIEIGTDRVDISQTEGAILTVETADAFQGKNTAYFVTDVGVAMEVNSPKVVADNEIAQLKSKVQSAENAILAVDGIDDGTGKPWEEIVDVSSWVKKYLIEEVFGNHDALMRSAYYYYQDSSSLLYAGPVWDYDLAIGNENSWQLQNPQAFWANRLASQPGVEMPWFYELYQKDVFYQRVVEMYQSVFLPELTRLISITIPEYTCEISAAAAVDKIRWNDDATLIEYADGLCNYLEQRSKFLANIWIDKKDYCIVRAAQQWGGYYAYYAVFTGETLQELPVFDSSDNQTFIGWYNESTGEPFDITQPITEDIEIYAKWVDKPSARIKQVLKLMPLAVLAVIGVAFVVVEFKRWRKIG